MHKKPDYKIKIDKSVLLVVDPQKAFGGKVPVPDIKKALENMKSAINFWKKVGGKIYLTKHIYDSKKQVGRISDFIPHIGDVLSHKSKYSDFHEGINGDVVIKKSRFNAFRNTSLERELKAKNIKTAIVCGLTTPICVQATVDALSMADFEVIVLEDACASQPMGNISAKDCHNAAIERMGYVFAEIVSTEGFLNKIKNG